MQFDASVFGAAPDFEVEPLAVSKSICVVAHVEVVLFIGLPYDEVQVATLEVAIEAQPSLNQSTYQIVSDCVVNDGLLIFFVDFEHPFSTDAMVDEWRSVEHSAIDVAGVGLDSRRPEGLFFRNIGGSLIKSLLCLHKINLLVSMQKLLRNIPQ